MIPIMPAPPAPPAAPPTPQYRCQTCLVAFATPFQLEIHMDAYERLISFLVERVAKAVAHLIPIELDPPDADRYSESTVSSKCPLPSCTSVKPLNEMKFHFMKHVDCFEVCPGCGHTWTNVHLFLVHLKECLKNADEAKRAHGKRRQRALVHRTVMRLQDAMDEFKTGPLDTRQDGSASFRQPQTPQTAFSGDPSLHPLLSRDAPVKRQKRGTGPVYAASRETRHMDQAIGLTGPATTYTAQGPSWRPPGLPSHAFSREPSFMQDTMPSSAPLNSILSPLSRPVETLFPVETPFPIETPRLAEASPEAPSNMTLPLDFEMDHVMQPVDWEMVGFT